MPDAVSPVRTLAVIGAGAMGHGIAQTALVAGIATTLHDVDEQALRSARAAIDTGLARLVERERMDAAAKDAAMMRLHLTTDLSRLAHADAVIEAAPERLELKRALFREVDAICATAVFLASNTSSLAIKSIAEVVRRKERVLGLHYFNPAQVLPLVEVVTPPTVAAEVVEAAEAFCRATGKTTVRVKDTPGFVVNRLFIPFALQAMQLLEDGVASADEIDQACKLGLGHSQGPLSTSDLVGLDVMLDIAQSLSAELRDPSVAAPAILRRWVADGRLGRKTGRGIFDYSARVPPRGEPSD